MKRVRRIVPGDKSFVRRAGLWVSMAMPLAFGCNRTPVASASPPSSSASSTIPPGPAVTASVANRTVATCKDGPLMLSWRYGIAAARLSDGRVMITGGHQHDGGPESTNVEFYDRGKFVSGPPMKNARGLHRLIPIAGGKRVLAIGGRTKSIEMFDVDKNTWTLVGAMKNAVVRPVVLPLESGKHILVAGGDLEWKGALSETIDSIDVEGDHASLHVVNANTKEIGFPEGGVVNGFAVDERTLLFLDDMSYRPLPPQMFDTRSGAFKALQTPSAKVQALLALKVSPADILLIDLRHAERESAHGLVPAVVVTDSALYNDVNEQFELVTHSARKHSGGAAVVLDPGTVLVVGGLDETAARSEICPLG